MLASPCSFWVRPDDECAMRIGSFGFVVGGKAKADENASAFEVNISIANETFN